MFVSSIDAFRQIGREQRYCYRNPLLRAFVWLFGSIGMHSRIRAGHVLKTISHINLPPNAQVLDAGSGRGLVLFRLAQRYPGYRLRGIDVEPSVIAETQRIAAQLKSSALTFVQGDLSELETLGGPYDLIVSIDVLEHIADDTKVLWMFRRALKSHGALVLHLPLRHQEQKRIFSAFKQHLVSDHRRDEYTPTEIQTKIEKTGFRLQSLRYGFGWQGELAFELNTLMWTVPPMRAALALLTYPLAWWLAYWDVFTLHSHGNSLIVVAQPTEE